MNVETNSLLEPVKYMYRNAAREMDLCSLNYLIDPYGRIAAYSCRLDYGRWDMTQCFEHDATSTLIAEHRQNSFFERLDTKRKEILETNNTLESWQTRWYDYDESGNLTASYRKLKLSGKEKIPAAMRDKSQGVARENFVRGNSEYYSPASLFQTTIRANMTDWPDQLDSYKKDAASSRALASNRLMTTARDDGRTEEFKYDLLGRLTEYDIKIERRSLRFKLEYDLLGRVVSMTGSKLDSQDQNKIAMENAIHIEFLNDSFNRRVLREVRDLDAGSYRVESTAYVNREPVMVVEKNEEKATAWTFAAQYLWGASQRETLTAILPRRAVEPNHGGKDYGTYSLLQDRMLNVILCTSFRENKIEIHDIASYWGFGENSTTGNIKSVETNNKNDAKPKKSFDHKYDNEADRFSADNGKGRILITLEQSAQLENLTLWAPSGLPTEFKAYVVEETVANPINNGITEANRVSHSQETKEGERDRLFSTSVNIPLGGKFGKYIVLEWSGAERDFSVNEFEVAVKPFNVGNLGFGGAWLDKETGLYYQGSRYRLPSMGGRFISPDPLGYLDGDNLYAYAHNDPLTWHDPDGEWAHILIGGVVGGILGGGGYALQCWWTGEEFSWAKFGVYTVAGAASGALAAATLGASAFITGGVAGAAYGGISGGGMELLNGGDAASVLWASAKSAAIGGTIGAISGGVAGHTLGLLNAPKQWIQALQPARGLITSTATGTFAGAVAGGLQGGYHGYQEGGVNSMISGAVRGSVHGAAFGAAGGALAYGIGKGLDYGKHGPRNQKQMWNKDRRSYWKQEANRNPDAYSADNIARMNSGKAPQRMNPTTGKLESMELHHNMIPQRSGLPSSIINQRGNLKQLWPQEHQAIHRGF